jgi:hypothetical protein
MTVGVGHRKLEAAASKEDFATVLKEADGAFLANQNFHDVEACMTRTADLADPTGRRPPQSPLFPSIHGPIPFPGDFRRACLNFNEDEHLTLEDDQVQLIAPVPPIGCQATSALLAIMLLGEALSHRPEIIPRRGRTAPPDDDRPDISPKHVLR